MLTSNCKYYKEHFENNMIASCQIRIFYEVKKKTTFLDYIFFYFAKPFKVNFCLPYLW